MRLPFKSIFATFFISITMSACAVSKPNDAQWLAALESTMPNFLKVTDFGIEAIQNLGNEVTPLWAIRYHATIAPTEDLFERDSVEEDVTFISVKTEKGTKRDIYGQIYSQRYQGEWQFEVKADGNVVSEIGAPSASIDGQRVIVRGSEEERAFRAEQQAKKREQEREAARLETLRRKASTSSEVLYKGKVRMCEMGLNRWLVKPENFSNLHITDTHIHSSLYCDNENYKVWFGDITNYSIMNNWGAIVIRSRGERTTTRFKIEPNDQQEHVFDILDRAIKEWRKRYPDLAMD